MKTNLKVNWTCNDTGGNEIMPKSIVGEWAGLEYNSIQLKSNFTLLPLFYCLPHMLQVSRVEENDAM